MTIRRITYLRSMVLGGLALGAWNAGHPAAAEAEDQECVQVGGGIVTNFLDITETLGTATGDLGGGLGVSVLSVTPGSGGEHRLSCSPSLGHHDRRHALIQRRRSERLSDRG